MTGTASARDVIEQEAICLDERRWQDWLALFTEDCVYWVPAWKDDDTLTADPQTELSHIYYIDRAALEDRIIRVSSNLSPASTPLARTAHILGGIRQTGAPGPGRVTFRSSWSTHVFWPQSNLSHTFFGRYEHELVEDGESWLIARKVITLQNDYLPSMTDFYCL